MTQMIDTLHLLKKTTEQELLVLSAMCLTLKAIGVQSSEIASLRREVMVIITEFPNQWTPTLFTV